MAGRTVKIYLKEGTPNSLLIAEIFNWTGKVFVIPRSQLVQIADRPEVKQTGIYVLVGQDLDEPTKERVYIGESDNVWTRLKQHNDNSDNDFWTRTIITISKDANRAKVVNATNPSETPLPESDRDDMDYFLEQIKMLLPVLGFSFTQTLPSSEILKDTKRSALIPSSSPIFVLNLSGGGGYASAREIDGEFIVLKDSHAKKEVQPHLSEAYKTKREQLFQEGKLQSNEQGTLWIFTDDIAFSSPSTAASVVTGASSNGRIVWKIKGENRTYKEWQEAQITSDETNGFLQYDT